MLSIGLIHGDLSEFNVLVAADGPVIIDLPQAVNAAGNNGAFAMLERDVNNLRGTLGEFAPELLETEYAREIWALFEAGHLKPESKLTGVFAREEAMAPPAPEDQLHRPKIRSRLLLHFSNLPLAHRIGNSHLTSRHECC
jgi:serine/threonine-protein kinase RIO1